MSKPAENYSEQFRTINAKLDAIMELIAPAAPTTAKAVVAEVVKEKAQAKKTEKKKAVKKGKK